MVAGFRRLECSLLVVSERLAESCCGVVAHHICTALGHPKMQLDTVDLAPSPTIVCIGAQP